MNFLLKLKYGVENANMYIREILLLSFHSEERIKLSKARVIENYERIN